MELTFRIPVVIGIPGSLSWIPGSKAQDSTIPPANIIPSAILTYLYYSGR